MENNKSVLIVDDVETDRYLLRRDLEAINYMGEIFEAENGREALDFLTQHEENRAKHGENFPPTIIFLDVNMPIMNGFEFLKAFSALRKSDYRFQSIFVMMFSSSEQESDIQQSSCYAVVKKYMIKNTYTREELKTIIQTPNM